MGIFRRKKRPPNTASTTVQPPTISEEKGPTPMDDTRFEIPSAILAAAVVAKSELTGKELAQYAVDLQRLYIRKMKAHRIKDNAAP
jgi:hypothetical protein